MIIFKSRTRSSSWWTAVPGVLSSQSHFLQLNATNTPLDLSSYGTISAPTTSVFTINGVDGIGGESANYVAYCFANVEGYCKVGTYVGNGNADGAFVYTGFSPTYVMIKGIDVADSWFILDTARDPSNEAVKYIQPNSNAGNGEHANIGINILSNGFKCTRAPNSLNGSGNDYTYLAMAHNPFQYATSR